MRYFALIEKLKKYRKEAIFFVVLVALGIALRLVFLRNMPFTNDEGAYLYDAKTILAGRLPGGDAIVKTPVAILFFSFFVGLTGGSIYAARIAVFVFGLALIFPLWAINGEGTKKRLIATALWLVSSASVVLAGLGQTETVAGFFGASAIAFLLLSLRKNTTKTSQWLFLSGISFALALGTRKTSLALALPLIIVIIQNKNGWLSRKKAVFYFGSGLIVAMLFLGSFLFGLYGCPGVEEFFGGGYARIVGGKLAGDSRVDIWGVSIIDTLKILGRIATAQLALFVGTFVGLVVVWRKKGRKIIKDTLFPLVSWIIGLFLLYLFWPTFLPDYAADFLVPATVLGAWLGAKIWERNGLIAKISVAGGFCLLNIFSYVSVISSPWTGMFSAKAVEKTALVLYNLVPRSDAVLTAGTIIPYLSGHHTPYDISHPLWYRYAFIAISEKKIFLPPWEQIASDVRTGKVKWVLLEHLTDYAYFRNEDHLIDVLKNNWDLVAVISNDTGFRDNPLELYRYRAR